MLVALLSVWLVGAPALATLPLTDSATRADDDEHGHADEISHLPAVQLCSGM